MPGKDIFLSYASEDRDRIGPLVRALEGTGWTVFWDRTIPAGKQWHRVIGRELETCRSVVVVWSKAAIESDWVLEEAGRGKDRGVLIPVRLDDVGPPLGFAMIQAADLVGWDGEASAPTFQSLVADISKIIGPPPTTQKEDVKTGAVDLRRHLARPPVRRVKAGREAPARKGRREPVATRAEDERTLDAILDLFSTRRAFFKGDEALLEDLAMHLRDRSAQRAVHVSVSLAQAVSALQSELARLRSPTHPSVKQALSRLLVACKDFVDRHGTFVQLPTLGSGERIKNPADAERLFGFRSTDSFEVYKALLEYLSRSFTDLLIVRKRALEVVDCIAREEPSLAGRGEAVRSLLSEGGDWLQSKIAALDRSARLVGDIISSTPDFKARREAAADLARVEKDDTVNQLISGASRLRYPKAWSQ